MTSTSSSINPIYYKAVAAGASAAVLDRFFCNKTEITDNAITAVAVAGGVLAGAYANSMIPNTIFPSDNSPTPLYTGSAIQSRVLEIGGAGLALYVLMRTGNISSDETVAKKVAIVAVSDAIGEYVSDYMSNKNLGFLI